MTSKNTEPVEDFLEVDDPIAGQNYVCLSFVDPEEIIQNKEAFKTAKFLQSYAKDKGMEFKEVYEDYLNFQYKFQDEIQNDFNNENKNINNIRGIKVRGVYSSKEEAIARSKKLQRNDSTFHVFIGQVGYWLPFNPCADKIEEEEFINNGLNELMKKYKENTVNKDLFYEEQKREKCKEAFENKKKHDEEKLKNKLIENNSESEPEPEPDAESEPEPEPDVESEPENNNVDDSLKKSLSDADPWLKNKLSENKE